MAVKFVGLTLTLCLSVAPVLAAPDPLEDFPGGRGTTADHSVQAFSHPLGGTRAQLRREFSVGNSFFNLAWVASPSSTTARDGLGPTFNATSCSACHFKDGRGRGLPDSDGDTHVSVLFRLGVKAGADTLVHPAYGGQLQPHGVAGVPGEGRPYVRFETIVVSYPDGLLARLARPIYEFFDLAFGAFGADTVVSPRVAPQMVGLGLVEAIPEGQILRQEDPYDADGDGISGRANRVWSLELGREMLGRFGWKAGQPSLQEQNAAAFVGDMGITSPLHPEEDCPAPQEACRRGRTQEDVPLERLTQVTTYTQLLTVPSRRDPRSPEVLRGREVFHQIGCASCHTPAFDTSPAAAHEVLRSQRIYPYSDFLLHDMGDELADDREAVRFEGLATTREWRTPPLWGLGLIPTVNGHARLLHDGRARGVEEAVLWHGGEGKAAREAFKAAPAADRRALVRFVESL